MVHHNFGCDKVVTSVKNHCSRPDVLQDLLKLTLLEGLLASLDLKRNSVMANSFLQGHLLFLDRAFSHNDVQRFTVRTVLSQLIVHHNNLEVITPKLIR